MVLRESSEFEFSCDFYVDILSVILMWDCDLIIHTICRRLRTNDDSWLLMMLEFEVHSLKEGKNSMKYSQ